MKLQNNSCFKGGSIVLWPHSNLLKSHGLIEVSSNLVGVAYLKIHGTGVGMKPFCKQPARNAATPESWIHGEVQDLVLARSDATRRQESGDTALFLGNKDIVGGVGSGFPLRRLGASELDCGNPRQVSLLGAPDCCHSRC